MLLGQFDFNRFGILDRLQGSGQVLWSHLQTNLIVLWVKALHLVLVKEVSLKEEEAARSAEGTKIHLLSKLELY